MNMTHDEMIAVIQAHKEGKTIEACAIGYTNWRVTADPPTWNFYAMDYRVKPEPPKPKEFWLKGCYIYCNSQCRDNDQWSVGPVIHVREVL